MDRDFQGTITLQFQGRAAWMWPARRGLVSAAPVSCATCYDDGDIDLRRALVRHCGSEPSYVAKSKSHWLSAASGNHRIRTSEPARRCLSSRKPADMPAWALCHAAEAWKGLSQTKF